MAKYRLIIKISLSRFDTTMPSVPLQSSCTQLATFLCNVLYSFDIHETYQSLSHYCFGPKKFSEVIRSSLQDEAHREEVINILDQLAEFANNELRMLLREINRETPEQHIKLRMSLAWDLWKIYEDLFPEDKKLPFFVSIFHDLNVSYAKNELIKSAVPQEVLEHFGENPVKARYRNPLSRDDSFYNVPIIKPEPCPFVRTMIEALDIMRLGNTGSQTLWTNIAQASFYSLTPLNKVNSMDAIDLIFDNQDILFTDELQSCTLDILEKILNITDKDCKRTILHEAQEKLLTRGIPYFEPIIKNFQEKLSNCINGLGSHNASQDDKEDFEKIRNELRFLVLISPRTTIKNLINHCFQNKDYTTGVLKVLRGFQAICNAIVQQDGKKCPLMIALIEEAVKQNAERINTDAENFSYVITAFCRKKLTVIKAKGEEGRQLRSILGEVVEESILEPSDVISYFCLPKIFSRGRSETELRFILNVLKRIISSIGSKNCELQYSFEMKGDGKIGTIHIPALFNLMHSLLLQYESKDSQIPNLCFSILKSLGTKLKEDDILFPQENIKFFLDSLAKDAWWFRYAVTEWYSHSLDNPLKEVPSGLYYALPEESRNKYMEIRLDFESSPVACLLYSLFELGLFDPELAVSLLSHGLEVLPLDDLLFDQIALALCDCCANPFFCHRIPSIIPVIERMIEIFDPRTAVPYVLDEINDNILCSVRQMKAVQIVGRATKMAYFKIAYHDSEFACYYPSVSKNCPKNPKEVAEHLLQAFCELSKWQVMKNVELSRELLKKSSKGNKDSARDYQKLQEQLFTQLVVLFHEAVMFSKLDEKNKALEILIRTLADYITEVQRSQVRILDDIKVPHKKTEYVYTQNPSRPVSPKIKNDVGTDMQRNEKQKYSDPQYKHPSQRTTSGYHHKQDFHNTSSAKSERSFTRREGRKDRYMDSMKAVSNQIPYEQTRQQVQRKFETPRNPTPLQDNNGNDRNNGRYQYKSRDFQGKSQGGYRGRSRGSYNDKLTRENYQSKSREDIHDESRPNFQQRTQGEYQPRRAGKFENRGRRGPNNRPLQAAQS